LGLVATLPDPAGPLGVTLAASLDGVPLRAELTLADATTALAGGLSALSLSAETGPAETPGNSLRFEGRAGHAPLAADGALEVRLGDPDALARLAGLPAPEVPPALASGGALSGQVTLTPEGSLHLRAGRLRAGPQALSAEADLTTAGARPRLVASLSADTIDLRPFLTSDAPAQAGTAGWSRAPIDVSALGLADAEVALRAGRVETGTLTLTALDLTTKLDAARAVTDIRSAEAFGGAITGQVVVNGRGGLSLRADLRADGLALRPMLTAFAGVNRLTGTGAGAVNVLASGGSVDALVRSAEGSGRLDLTAGEILGLDLAGMLRTLDMSYMGEGAKTIFDAIRGSFTIAGGVLTNDDLRLDAPLVQATGRGRVDLGARTLDYRVTPVALAGADGSGGVRVPLTISGPWSAPRFGLDLGALADERLRLEREALDARAQDALAREAERRGIVREEGESLGDAARRSLEDSARERVEGEVGRALQGLFGGN
ncbi:MAG: AsmA family protein, partial [Rhodobacteraceae bacterium]|nr:AsmA family protein [Paracoccaceae bacterium]